MRLHYFLKYTNSHAWADYLEDIIFLQGGFINFLSFFIFQTMMLMIKSMTFMATSKKMRV